MADRYVGSRIFLFSPSYFCSSSLLQFCRGVKCVFAVSLFSELLLQLSALLLLSSCSSFCTFSKVLPGNQTLSRARSKFSNNSPLMKMLMKMQGSQFRILFENVDTCHCSLVIGQQSPNWVSYKCLIYLVDDWYIQNSVLCMRSSSSRQGGRSWGTTELTIATSAWPLTLARRHCRKISFLVTASTEFQC